MSLRFRILVAVAGSVLASLTILHLSEDRLASQAASQTAAALAAEGSSAPEFLAPMALRSNNPTLWARENVYTNLSLHQTYGGSYLRKGVSYDKADYPPDIIKILAVGDSYTYGIGLLDSSFAWPQRLEVALNKRSNGPFFKVIPLTLYGASAVDQAEWLSDDLLQRLEPDLIITAHVGNDMIPSGNEKMLCGHNVLNCELDTISNFDEYLRCRTGDGSLVARITSRYISKIYPFIAEKILTRHCDALAVRTESKSGVDPADQEDEYRLFFNHAVERLAEVDDKYSHFSALLRQGSADEVRHARFKEALDAKGVVTASMHSTNKLLRGAPDEQVSANPADSHPGSALTAAYVADMLKTIEVLHPELYPEIDPKPLSRELVASRELVTYMLPIHGVINESRSDRFSATVAPANDSRYEPLRKLQLPSFQEVPCTVLGAAHVRLSLNPYLPVGSKLRFLASEQDVDVYISGLDYRSAPTLRRAGKAQAGKPFPITLNQGEIGLLLKPMNAEPCLTENNLLTPKFGFTLQVLS
jgi:hypothetical protein